MEHALAPRRMNANRLVAVLCALALAFSPLLARADDAGGDQIAAWSWEKFFDYAACGLAAATAVTSGGLTIVVAVVTCGRALYVHRSD